MQEQEADISTLQPEGYFNMIRKMEEGGVHFMNVTKTDIKKRGIMPIVIATIVIAFFIAIASIVVWLSIEQPETPLVVPIISVATSVLFIGATVYALKQRLHEIKGGELDEAAKY